MTDTQQPWHATVLTLYPEMFPGPLGHALAGRALDKAIWSLEARSLRDWGLGKHRDVDDTPAGGGPGMVLRADVVGPAIDAAQTARPGLPTLLLSPRGRPLDQARVRQLATGPGAILLAGRFEGIDQRVIDARDIEEVSVGDYILSGGETAAFVLLDAIVRLLPGVMGTGQSGEDESFEGDGLLEYPHYTRPRDWDGHSIPDVLLSGDHGAIARWRRAEAERLTAKVRPDLLAASNRKPR